MSIFSSIFGSAASPYEDAMAQYQKYNQLAREQQQPFYNAGTKGLNNYSDWLEKMQDPIKFVNNITGRYQQSPYAKTLQQNSLNAAQNAASASGLLGSTPFTNYVQQQANDISNQDMQQWLGNVLGINTQYGNGQNNLANYGQHSADILSNLYSQLGGQMGEAAYGRRAGMNQDISNDLGLAGSLIGNFHMPGGNSPFNYLSQYF